MNLLQSLQRVDRRVLYALLLVAVCIPFFITFHMKMKISPAAQSLYEAVEKLPEGSFVLLGVDWSAGSRGENGAQTEALMRHLMRRKLRFAILAFEPQSTKLTQGIALRLQTEYRVKGIPVEEGVTWVNWGYRTDPVNFLKGLVLDVPTTVAADTHNHPVSALPVMNGIRTGRDVKFLLDVTPSATYQYYIQFFQGTCRVPMGLAPTAVMAPEAFNLLDSHQLVGILTGLQGAAEYEQLLNEAGKATKASNSSASAQLLIILLIGIGNLAMLMDRLANRREAHR